MKAQKYFLNDGGERKVGCQLWTMESFQILIVTFCWQYLNEFMMTKVAKKHLEFSPRIQSAIISPDISLDKKL